MVGVQNDIRATPRGTDATGIATGDMSARIAFHEERFSHSSKVDVLCLLSFAAFVSFWGLASGPPLGNHEAIVAQGARQIRESGDWLIPYVNDIPFVRKPPLAFWLAASCSMVVDPPVVAPPVSVLAARLPSALAGVLTVMLVYALGRSMFGHRTGMVSGLIMACCAGGLFFSHNAQVEMVLTLFCTASFTFFWFGTERTERRKTYLVLFYGSFALAMLAKAPLPLAVVGIPLAAWWFVVMPIARPGDDGDGESPGRWQLFVGQIRGLGELLFAPGIALFLLLVLPRPIYVLLKIDHALDLWKLEFVGRYTGSLYDDAKPFWYYLPLALGLIFPFTLSLPEAVASPFLGPYRQWRKGLLFVLTWTGVTFLFLSSSEFKAPRYLVVCVPGLALLLGPTLDRLFLARRAFSERGMRAALVAVAVALPTALVFSAVPIADQYPEALSAYWIGGLVFTAGTIGSCVAFVRRNRVLSLAVLPLTVALGFAGSWVMLGQGRVGEGQALALVAQLKAQDIGGDDRITWAVGRPDARVMYYGGMRVYPLFSPLEMASRREGRRHVEADLLTEGEERLRRLLSRKGSEEYVIIDAKYWDLLRGRAPLLGHELFRVSKPNHDPGGEDWVVVANRERAGA